MLDQKLFYDDTMFIVDNMKLLLKESNFMIESKDIMKKIIDLIEQIDDNLKIFNQREIENYVKKLLEVSISIYQECIVFDNELSQTLFTAIDLIEVLCYKYIFHYKIEDAHELILKDTVLKLDQLLENIPSTMRQLPDMVYDQYFKTNEKTILFVDDSIMIRKICERIAHTKGFHVMIANDGLHGLRLALKYPFDLIFSDVNMPKVNGFEMVAAIRKLKHHKFTPIVMLTTERDPQMMNYAKSMGVRAWLTKPFTKEKLFETFTKLLD